MRELQIAKANVDRVLNMDIPNTEHEKEKMDDDAQIVI